jgi:RNA recognition motif-containing protein
MPNWASYSQQYIQQPYYQQLQYGPQLQAQQAGPTSGDYTMSSSGLPVNTRGGTVKTESRGVFVTGISYNARRHDIKDLFGHDIGEVREIEMQTHPTTKKFQGKATVQYSTSAEAKKAVEKLNGMQFMGMMLVVRPDRASTAVSPPQASSSRQTGEPVIVDGSRGQVR